MVFIAQEKKKYCWTVLIQVLATIFVVNLQCLLWLFSAKVYKSLVLFLNVNTMIDLAKPTVRKER